MIHAKDTTIASALGSQIQTARYDYVCKTGKYPELVTWITWDMWSLLDMEMSARMFAICHPDPDLQGNRDIWFCGSLVIRVVATCQASFTRAYPPGQSPFPEKFRQQKHTHK